MRCPRLNVAGIACVVSEPLPKKRGAIACPRCKKAPMEEVVTIDPVGNEPD